MGERTRHKMDNHTTSQRNVQWLNPQSTVADNVTQVHGPQTNHMDIHEGQGSTDRATTQQAEQIRSQQYEVIPPQMDIIVHTLTHQLEHS